MGSEIDPSGSETSLRPSRHIWTYGWHMHLGLIATPNTPNRGYNLPSATKPPLPPTPLPTACLPDNSVCFLKSGHTLTMPCIRDVHRIHHSGTGLIVVGYNIAT